MKILPIIIVFTLVTATQIHGKSVLDRISRADLDNEIQIYAYVNEPPLFKQRLSNKRLDVTLLGTDISDDISGLAPDDVIVKTLISPDLNNTNLSFFFRYVPQDIKISTDNAGTIVIDIIPGNKFTGTYKYLADELGTIFSIDRDRTYPANPVNQSSFSNNWSAFFTSFQSDTSIAPSLSVFIPPFPWIDLIADAETMTDYPAELVQILLSQDWLSSLALIQKALKSGSHAGSKPYLALLHAEILFRLGNVDTASRQLKLLQQTYRNEPIDIVARYVNLLIEARKGNYNRAHIEINHIAQSVSNDHRITPYLHLALLETGLALQQTGDVSEIIKNVPHGSDDVNLRFLIRTADFYHTQKDYAQALHRYAAVQHEQELYRLPYSLNNYCLTLFENQWYRQSSGCYQNLADILLDEEQRAKALYLAATTGHEQSWYKTDIKSLDHIIRQYPDTEAALKSELKKTDLCFSHDLPCNVDGTGVYDRLSQTSHLRNLSSEASFKKALLHHFSGNDPACIEELMILVRNFQSGEIRLHARALLIQLLPEVIDSLLGSGDDIDAVALVLQNRLFFDNRWIDLSVLLNLAPALERLGLYREAIELLLFLRNEYDSADQQEIYLALTRLAHLQGNTYLVEDFSSQYFHDYPDGLYYEDILYYRISATYISGRIDQAGKLLPYPLPERSDFRFLAASIFFQQDAFDKSASVLEPMHKGLLPNDQIFILAESLYELGSIDDALIYFSLIEDVPQYLNLSLYRMAQIEQIGSGITVGYNHLKKLAASSTDRQWQRFAAQELNYEQLLEM